LRGCDLVKIKISDLVSGGRVRNRAMIIRHKTKRPVQFEILEPARPCRCYFSQSALDASLSVHCPFLHRI
jgi:hypothetical protein